MDLDGDLMSRPIGTYGSLGVPAMANIPAGDTKPSLGRCFRKLLALRRNWFDSAGNQGTLNDLWKYRAANGPGSSARTFTISRERMNFVCCREQYSRFAAQAVSWIDSSGISGSSRINYNLNSSIGQFNDLWKI